MNMNKLYLGCDPEIFLIDAAGAFRSGIGKIGGSKQEPRRLPIGDGFAVQEDNVALEFNIPPAEGRSQFVESITKIKSYLADEVKKLGLAFSTVSAASYPFEELCDPKAMEFGCDPDFNAWTLKRNPRPKAKDITLRSCGGHVHVGYPFATQGDKITFIKYMDLFLGVPSVFMDNGELRKQLYGKAGAFREKSYGVEYRTLSNYWIFDEKLIDWVWRSTERALVAMDNEDINIDRLGRNIQTAINKNNKDVAASLIDTYKLEMVC